MVTLAIATRNYILIVRGLILIYEQYGTTRGAVSTPQAKAFTKEGAKHGGGRQLRRGVYVRQFISQLQKVLFGCRLESKHATIQGKRDCERKRHAPSTERRQIQKSQLIRVDHSACLAGKGIHFAVNRLVCHLQRHYRKYGKNGYALVFDFSKYFDNIEHKPLKDIIDSEYTDTRLAGLVKQLVDDFGDIGLGLGSQISQACALRYPNRLDHYIKEVLRIKGYARYMDDGYLLHESKEYLQKCLSDIKQICGELGIKLNAKKTQIIKISRGITFLQRRFVLTETGKVIIKPRPRGIVKMRRKLRVFKRKLDAGKMAFADIKTSFVSFKGHLKHCNAHRIIVRLNALFDKIFYGRYNT